PKPLVIESLSVARRHDQPRASPMITRGIENPAQRLKLKLEVLGCGSNRATNNEVGLTSGDG
ncbi:hypothetical protein, partial [Nocardia sp. NPDC004260]